MNKEIKRQLILSMSVLVVVVMTLIFWYDNFVFHTYISQKQFQSCYQGSLEDVIIEGFELYQNKQDSYYGNARIMALKNDFFLKDDVVSLTFVGEREQQAPITLKLEYIVQSDNEVCMLSSQKGDILDDFSQIENASIQMTIHRHQKLIYDQKIPLNKVVLNTYTGANKDYVIQNVYVTSYWFKTGLLSFTDQEIAKTYKYCTVDYMLLKELGDPNNMDDYDRFAYVSQDMDTLLNEPKQQSYFYDQEGSLLDRDIRCVVTLKKDEKDKNPLIFTIDLHKAIQEVVIDE